MPTLTSRVTAASAALLAAAAVLTGCASDGPAADGSTAVASGEFPVTVEHAYGETTIPSEPKRVVTVGRSHRLNLI